MHTPWRAPASAILILIVAATLAMGCGKKPPPIARPAPPPPPPAAATTPSPPPAPPQPVKEPVLVPPEPIAEDPVGSRSLDDLNRDSPLKPVFFDYDSADVDQAGQSTLNANAELLKKYPAWIVTIEGHCDERGTAEYNLALGERRAVAARAYLVSLGISADRFRTVSYGKEFPFDSGHSEPSWTKNRRAQFVITAK